MGWRSPAQSCRPAARLFALPSGWARQLRAVRPRARCANAVREDAGELDGGGWSGAGFTEPALMGWNRRSVHSQCHCETGKCAVGPGAEGAAGRLREGLHMCVGRGGSSLCSVFPRGNGITLCLLLCSEDQDELHCQDTDSDVPEQRDGRCKVKWTQEEVSEGRVRAADRAVGGVWYIFRVSSSSCSLPAATTPTHGVLLLGKALCLFC